MGDKQCPISMLVSSSRPQRCALLTKLFIMACTERAPETRLHRSVHPRINSSCLPRKMISSSAKARKCSIKPCLSSVENTAYSRHLGPAFLMMLPGFKYFNLNIEQLIKHLKADTEFRRDLHFSAVSLNGKRHIQQTGPLYNSFPEW